MTQPTLSLNVTGTPGSVQIILGADADHLAAFPLDGLTPAVGGHAGQIMVAGTGLGDLAETERHKLLRHARHLLAPGGRLSLPVGRGRNQFPGDGLNEAAWLTGFGAWVDFVAGRAVLTKPLRSAGEADLVSIVMPAYKSDWFAEALTSAQEQTWPHCEIVVCDDSPDGRIAAITQLSRGPHPVRYIRNPGTLGGRANYIKCFDEARGHFVKHLNDDDLLHPDCCARLVAALQANPSATLATSHRQLMDGDGRELPDEVWNTRVITRDGLLDGRLLASLVLTKGMNLIGEPTTVMFRKDDLTDSRPHLMSFAGNVARKNGDMSTWTSLLSRGDAVYLTESLSYFRQHEAQVQRDPEFHREAVLAWYELRDQATAVGLLDATHLKAPGAVDLLETRGVSEGEALFSTNEVDAAVSVFRAILQRDPGHTRARGNLACAHWAAGRQAEALVEGVLAHAAAPGDETLALNLQDMLAACV